MAGTFLTDPRTTQMPAKAKRVDGGCPLKLTYAMVVVRAVNV